MKQEIKLILSKQDLIDLLSLKGFNAGLDISLLDEEGGLTFPLTIQWSQDDNPQKIAGIDPNLYKRFEALYRSGDKITAIKEARHALNIGLKEAKDLIEQWFDRGYMGTI